MQSTLNTYKGRSLTHTHYAYTHREKSCTCSHCTHSHRRISFKKNLYFLVWKPEVQPGERRCTQYTEKSNQQNRNMVTMVTENKCPPEPSTHGCSYRPPQFGPFFLCRTHHPDTSIRTRLPHATCSRNLMHWAFNTERAGHFHVVIFYMTTLKQQLLLHFILAPSV